MAVFRSIKGSNGSNLTHNYRPVQPLDDRVIYRSIYNKNSEWSKPTEPSKPTVLTTVESTAQSTTAQSATAQPTTAQTISKPTNAPTTSTTPGKVTMAMPTNEVTDASMPERSTIKPIDNDSKKSGQGRVQGSSGLYLVSFIFIYFS